MSKREEFHKELKKLLRRYNAELSIEEEGELWDITSKIVVDFEWDSQSEENPTPSLNLGDYEDGKS